jgi:hypothetical protein
MRYAALAALAALLLAVATQSALRHAPSIPLTGIGFAIAAFVFARAARLARPREAAPAPWPAPVAALAGEAVALAAILAAALFFRFFRFTSFPPGLWYDEGLNGMEALTLIDKHQIVLWSESADGRPTLYLYLLAGALKLFGTNLIAMRLLPALAGLGAVAAFYALARRLLDRPGALVATALLAVARWPVIFSRISWEASLVPVIEIAAVYFLVRGLDTGRRWTFAVSGALLATGLYTYLAFRMVPVVFAMLLVYAALTQREIVRARLRDLLVLAAVFAALAAPLGAYTITHPDDVLARSREVSVFNDIDTEGRFDPLRHNVLASARMMNVGGDPNGRSNIPHAPMLDVVTGALLVLGLAAAVACYRDWRRGGIAAWYVLALVPGALSLTRGNPSAIRGLGAIAPAFLLIGLAVSVLWQSLAGRRGGAAVFAIIAAAMVASSASVNYYDLFRRQAHDRAVYDAFDPVYGDIGRAIARDGDTKRVLVSSGFASHPSLQVLAHGVPYALIDARSAALLEPGPVETVLLLGLDDAAIIRQLQTRFPELQRDQRTDPFGRPTFIIVTIPPAP